MPAKFDQYKSPAMKTLGLHGLLLFTGKAYSLSQLARTLDCSKQTVLRNIEQLQLSRQLEIDAWFEGKERWYKARTPGRKPEVTLDPEAIQHLLMCRDMVWHLLSDDLRAEIGRAIRHTTVLLPNFDAREQAFQQLAESRAKGAIDYTAKQRIIESLLEALRQRCVVKVRYRSGLSSAARNYTVAPLKLVAYREGLYIRCRFAAKRHEPDQPTLLQLAVHRIQSIVVTDETFDPEEGVEKAGRKTFGFVPGTPFRVRVAFHAGAANYVSERTWSDDQVIERQRDGSAILTFTATSAFEVIAWVLSFGADAELLTPLDLRLQMRQTLHDALNRYETAYYDVEEALPAGNTRRRT